MVKKLAAITFAFAIPVVAFAATIQGILDAVNNLLTQMIGILIAIATIVFMWGIIRYVSAGGDEEKIREGRNLMVFGIIGLSVLISVWGIVKLVTSTFGLGGEPIPHIESPDTTPPPAAAG